MNKYDFKKFAIEKEIEMQQHMKRKIPYRVNQEVVKKMSDEQLDDYLKKSYGELYEGGMKVYCKHGWAEKLNRQIYKGLIN